MSSDRAPRDRLRSAVLLAALVGLLGATGPRGCVPHAAFYSLLPESQFTQGCFAPCLCPIMLGQELRGSFVLIEDSSSPASPFRDFEVRGVRWWTTLAGAAVPITGSGHYRVGGEVAITQELQLDLQIGDGPVQHFDSGVVAGGGEFPAIDVRIAVNGAFCFDTVIDVVAKPLFSFL